MNRYCIVEIFFFCLCSQMSCDFFFLLQMNGIKHIIATFAEGNRLMGKQAQRVYLLFHHLLMGFIRRIALFTRPRG